MILARANRSNARQEAGARGVHYLDRSGLRRSGRVIIAELAVGVITPCPNGAACRRRLKRQRMVVAGRNRYDIAKCTTSARVNDLNNILRASEASVTEVAAIVMPPGGDATTHSKRQGMSIPCRDGLCAASSAGGWR